MITIRNSFMRKGKYFLNWADSDLNSAFKPVDFGPNSMEAYN